MSRPKAVRSKIKVKFVPLAAQEQFKASSSLLVLIIYFACLVNLIFADIAIPLVAIIEFHRLTMLDYLLIAIVFLLCLTMTFFGWKWTAKERNKYLEAKRKTKPL